MLVQDYIVRCRYCGQTNDLELDTDYHGSCHDAINNYSNSHVRVKCSVIPVYYCNKECFNKSHQLIYDKEHEAVSTNIIPSHGRCNVCNKELLSREEQSDIISKLGRF